MLGCEPKQRLTSFYSIRTKQQVLDTLPPASRSKNRVPKILRSRFRSKSRISGDYEINGLTIRSINDRLPTHDTTRYWGVFPPCKKHSSLNTELSSALETCRIHMAGFTNAAIRSALYPKLSDKVAM